MTTRAHISADLLEQIAREHPTIAVIGDVMLDGWWMGRTERMSREAPAPVVEIAAREIAPGGAANTAMNLASLGARVRIVGLVGDDEPGRDVARLLRAAGIDTAGLLVDPSISTTTKNRIVSGDQVLLRIDDVPAEKRDEALQELLADAALTATAQADAEIISDYGSGAIDGILRQALIGRRSRPRLTVVDAHELRHWRALAPDIVTPNAEEFCRAISADFATGLSRSEAVAARAADLLAATGASAAAVTLDREGAVLVAGGAAPYRTFAHPTPERQASGAGDTFVAALTMARLAELPFEPAAEFAQLAADIVVQRRGTAVCTLDDLLTQLEQPVVPALDAHDLAEMLARHRREGERIVFTNGCFDVLHRGHTAYLRQAKRLGGVLVVAVNDDASVRRLKGPDRPINPARDRAAVLAALECVDYVTVFDSDTPIPLITALQPDVYVKGGDYTPAMLEETAAVEAYGGEVRILDYVPELSTSAIIGRIRDNGSASAKDVPA
ncbi:D-glycero-beta-D-manno-heptose 1-phosphate adenylyltransferase [Parafrigoribacterium soli]|uniref:D-glycero-beta-D-manno-heptose 1-phosphate adenylyltransferase n=1 Tax=Parafrigoribacterium soli TaxID=3144663 RepID=UPI0032EC4D9A